MGTVPRRCCSLGAVPACVLLLAGCGRAPAGDAADPAAPAGGVGRAAAPAGGVGRAESPPPSGGTGLGERLVALRAARAARPALVETEREVFEFGTPAREEDAGDVTGPVVAPFSWEPPAAPDVGQGEAPLRVIGVVEAPPPAGRVAVVSDGAGVYHGRVGEVVAGRYRVVAVDGSEVAVEVLPGRERRRLRFR